MFLLFRALWVAALAKSASASEAASPDDGDDETSLLQVMHRKAAGHLVGVATNHDDDARSRCRTTMESAPRSIQRAMFTDGEGEVNLCSEDNEVTEVSAADFQSGTYIITSPGIYTLTEDITMHPNTEHMMPPMDSDVYPKQQGYWLGFVAAIAVACDNVFLDLNDHKIAMSPEFLMRQRFFAIVQLGERPFEAQTGPPQFSHMESAPHWASNVVISGGTLGTTSHTGVHGWNNNNIWINGVEIKNFETAGIQINGATNVHITNTDIGPSLGNGDDPIDSVPAMATLSQAQLLLRIVEGEDLPDDDGVFETLRESVEAYIAWRKEVVDLAALDPDDLAGLREPERIFYNPSGLPDGSSLHGIVLHQAKLAIHDFAACPDWRADQEDAFFGPVKLKNVEVKNLKLETDEVVSMQWENTPIMGPAGDVVQAFRNGFLDETTGKYAGNVLSEAQLALGRLKNARLLEANANEIEDETFQDETFVLFGATNIPQELLDWKDDADRHQTWSQLADDDRMTFVCMKDAMTHRNKGVMGVRIEYYDNVKLKNVRIKDLENIGTASEVPHCLDDGDLTYSGNDARGITMSHVRGLKAQNVKVKRMTSHNGLAFGVEERIDVVHNYGAEYKIQGINSAVSEDDDDDDDDDTEDVGLLEYDIDGISGGKGSTDHDQGLRGMLNSDDGH